MAGAGYKLFNTGDVLTAAQVNTYLNEQTVMVFADASARTTALSGVVAEGMMSYLKDTDAVEKYNGSAWVSVAGSTSPLTTKGDLYTYSTADARLAVGSNGDSLVADSAATTGLRWQINQTAGKNRIINGDFRWNQRNFTSITTGSTYGFDLWKLFVGAGAGTTTYTPQTFTLGTAPVTGYEATNFARIATTGQSGTGIASILAQHIESVRTFANQTVTLSFWAKAGSGTPSIAASYLQSFGTGGSPSSTVAANIGKFTLSTSWTRYSASVTIPSISGKTLGTAGDDYLRVALWTSAGSDFDSVTNTLGIQTATIDIWGVQVEPGSVATAFQTATGTLQGELAACQRYYEKSYNLANAPGATSVGNYVAMKVASNTVASGEIYGYVPYKVAKRTAPTVTIYSFANGTTTQVSTPTGGDLANNSGTVYNGGEGGFSPYNNSGGTVTTANLAIILHFTASAEL